jgi:hypothetical protein
LPRSRFHLALVEKFFDLTLIFARFEFFRLLVSSASRSNLGAAPRANTAYTVLHRTPGVLLSVLAYAATLLRCPYQKLRALLEIAEIARSVLSTRWPRESSASDVSDIGECQRTASFALDVREAVFHREAGSY